VIAAVGRRNSAKKASAAKKRRRKYRQLEADGLEEADEALEVVEEGPLGKSSIPEPTESRSAEDTPAETGSSPPPQSNS
jgi:hypothetical protein